MPFRVVRQDITKMEVDAIVNSANPRPIIGHGSDTAVYNAAGREQLLEARRKIGYISRGQAAATPGFALPVKYIIHTVGPRWMGGIRGEEEMLASCYRECLRLAKKLGCRSIAFPMISTGNYGFPRDLAMQIALNEVNAFQAQEKDEFEIFFVVFGERSTRLASHMFPDLREYIDKHYVREKQEEEYGAPRGYDRFRKEACKDDCLSVRERPQLWPENGRTEPAQVCMPEEERVVGDLPEELFASPGKDRIEAAWKTCVEPWSRRSERQNEETWDGTKASQILQEDSAPDAEEHIGFNQNRTLEESRRPAQKPTEHSKGVSVAPNAVPMPRKADSTVTQKGAGSPIRKPAVQMAVTFSTEPTPKNVSVDVPRSLQNLLKQVEETFQQSLLRLMKERGLEPAQVYTAANMTKQHFAKIKKNPEYLPKKKTVIALALALKLNLDEAKDLLGRAGYAFSRGSAFDVVMTYFFENRVYDIMTIEWTLDELNLPPLCSYD